MFTVCTHLNLYLFYALMYNMICISERRTEGIDMNSFHRTVHARFIEPPKAALSLTNKICATLENFAQVSPILYRGAAPSREGFEQLKKMGLRTFIDLGVFPSKEKTKGLGLQYIHLRTTPYAPNDKDVLNFLKVITNPKNQPAFVFCWFGSDRTGMMVGIYRMYVEKWPAKKALEEMKEFGFNPIWFPLKQYLENLDIEKLQQKLDQTPDPEVEITSI